MLFDGHDAPPQGLAVVFADEYSDVAVFELLQDIPPEWGAVMAGWEAATLDYNFTYTTVSHPLGDSQKIAMGRVYELFYGTTMYSQNDVDLVRNVSCNTHTCGFYSSVVEAGSITFGSSGAGVLSDDLGKVVGVMSSGDGGPCPRPSDPYGKGSPIYVIGSLGAAWEHGFHSLYNLSREDEGSAEYEVYTRSRPTITVGNVVPEVYPRLGPTSCSVALQQSPARTTTVRIAAVQPWLVHVVPSSLTFDETSWHQEQFFNITAAGEHAGDVGAQQFDIRLTWAVRTDAGEWEERTKTISGFIWPGQPGTGFLNPWKIEVPFQDVVDLDTLGPDIPLVTERNGPFVPAGFLEYYPRVSMGLIVTTCLNSTGHGSRSIVSSIFSADWSLDTELPQHRRQTDRDECKETVTMLQQDETYYIIFYQQTNLTLPHGPDTGSVAASISISEASRLEVLAYFVKTHDLVKVKDLPFKESYLATSVPTVFYYCPKTDIALNIKTCSQNTTVGVVVDVYDDKLDAIRSTSRAGPSISVNVSGVDMAADRVYLVMVSPTKTEASVGRGTRQFCLTLEEMRS
ncbi:hypothetical protein ACKKBF_B18110 [Auxenochlorella protothecoides x Auxenochlorella symbiontica]